MKQNEYRNVGNKTIRFGCSRSGTSVKTFESSCVPQLFHQSLPPSEDHHFLVVIACRKPFRKVADTTKHRCCSSGSFMPPTLSFLSPVACFLWCHDSFKSPMTILRGSNVKTDFFSNRQMSSRRNVVILKNNLLVSPSFCSIHHSTILGGWKKDQNIYR